MVTRIGTGLLFSVVASMVVGEQEAADAEPALLRQHRPACGKCAFFESFEGDWQSGWESSTEDKYTGRVEIVERPNDGISGDHGLMLPHSHRHYGISAQLNTAFQNDAGLVVQYEVALLDGLDCGGAYIKLLSAADDMVALSESTPYSIMFGPDKCGATNKVHVIFRHTNSKTGDVEEKHLSSPPTFPSDTLSHTYTLVVGLDNTYQVLIDGVPKKSGSLFDDFEPPFQPPEMIDDPEDTKPGDWVDLQKIEDPEDLKPDDWDEDAPMYIADDEAVKPSDWQDDEPGHIPDPDAQQPDDWDEEEDGSFEPPLIPNPKCVRSGCGQWVRPEKRNPDYKGKWTPRMIDNPAYKGEWSPAQISNPGYYVVTEPAKITPIGAVAIEVWVTNQDIVFDNMLIAADPDVAKAVAAETWALRHQAEQARQAESLSNMQGAGDRVLTLALENRMSCVGLAVVLLLVFLISRRSDANTVPHIHKKDDDADAPADKDDKTEHENEKPEDMIVEEEQAEREEKVELRRSKRRTQKD